MPCSSLCLLLAHHGASSPLLRLGGALSSPCCPVMASRLPPPTPSEVRRVTSHNTGTRKWNSKAQAFPGVVEGTGNGERVLGGTTELGWVEERE